eukprot:560921-Karenia_brevis.AAC.1
MLHLLTLYAFSRPRAKTVAFFGSRRNLLSSNWVTSGLLAYASVAILLHSWRAAGTADSFLEYSMFNHMISAPLTISLCSP